MDNLPDHLIVMILSRLSDSTELARCKCVSKTINTLARQVRSIHLYCSLDRFTKMRSPETMSKVTPLKTIFSKLISNAEAPIESVSLGMEESLDRFYCYDHQLEEKSDDLFLTSGLFSDGWMTNIGHGLKSISIAAFTPQTYSGDTNILEVISYNCHSLVELTLKSACLSVDNMHLMPLLTRLTLIDMTIFDKSLNKLMECIPCLEVLMIDSCGDTNPKIHHVNLKKLKWVVSDCPETPVISSITVITPNLTKLELECENPIIVSIHAPLVSYFHFALERANVFYVEKFMTLKTLRLVSSHLHCILLTSPSSTTVQDLTLDSPGPPCYSPYDKRIELSDVFTVYPNITSLTLGSEFWSQLMLYPSAQWAPLAKGLTERLKQITGYLVLEDIDIILTFILYVNRIFSNLTDIVLFIRGVDPSVSQSFVSLCTGLCPKVRFRWGTW